MKRFFASALALIFTLSALPAFAAGLNVNGSTTVLPIMQKMVEAYMAKNPGVEITVSGGGSGNGIKALLDKNTDIAMSSRELKESELKLARERGLALAPLAIAIDAVIPMVHPENPVNNLTKAQLQAIFSGSARNWKEVGGPDKQIVVVSRDTSSGTYEAWNELIMGKDRVSPAALLSASSGAMLQTVAGNKLAIGYDSYGYLNNTVKPVSVNNIAGTPATAAGGTYPLSRKLWIITSGKPAGQAADFISFIMSADGQQIVKGSGAVPVK